MTLVGHVDVDAFFAAVEQRDKPSLRGRPVVVGGVGPRGVVATASYEARRFGVHSAMPTAQARRLCPSAAVLAGRFAAYRSSSSAVMAVLARHSGTVEQVSLDEAYLALDPDVDVAPLVDSLRAGVLAATGLTASVGVGPSKLVAKIASDDAKPDGSLLLVDDSVQHYLDPLPVRRLPGLGPQSAARLSRLGVATVRQLRALDRADLVGLLGDSHGSLLWRLSRGQDDRPVVAEHDVKSVSVEETFDTDLTDEVLVRTVVARMAGTVADRMRASGVSGRTVTIKARYPDFTTVNRSTTRSGPTDDARVLRRMAESLLGEVDLQRGVRLLGVGCSGLTSWVQDDLFDERERREEGEHPAAPDPATGEPAWPSVPPSQPAQSTPFEATPTPSPSQSPRHRPRWLPGQDVSHTIHGRGWVWGSGAGVVTVRFEHRHSEPGKVRTFGVDDPALAAAEPEPLDGEAATRPTATDQTASAD